MSVARTTIVPTGREAPFDADEIIVSKTDLTGKITYANRVFMRVSHYDESELLGAPHSLIRHPDMPRAVFRYLWSTLEGGREVFAYVNNLARNGDNYWVLAHVTPSFDGEGRIVGYHSNRRVGDRDKIDKASVLYARLLQEERRHADRRVALESSVALFADTLRDAGVTYDQWVWSL